MGQNESKSHRKQSSNIFRRFSQPETLCTPKIGHRILRNYSKKRANSLNMESALEMNIVETPRQINLLVLGTTAVGKSTIVRQLQANWHTNDVSNNNNTGTDQLYNNELVPSNYEFVRNDVIEFVLGSVWQLADAMDRLGLMYDSDHLLRCVSVLWCEERDAAGNRLITAQMKNILRCFWSDRIVRRLYEHRNEYDGSDCLQYFMQSLDRLSQPNYVPSKHDLLHCHFPTTGVYEMKTSATSGNSNLHDSIELFSLVCRSKWFRTSSLLLFLNKVDQLAHRLRYVSLKVTFPDYKNCGADEVDDCCGFIGNKFLQGVPELTDAAFATRIHLHRLNALNSTDTINVSKLIIQQAKLY